MNFRIQTLDDIAPRAARLIPSATYDALVDLARFADSRAVSIAAYPHACEEDKKLRDLVDAAMRAIGPAP